METARVCPISGAPMERAFRATILGKFEVQYFYCPATGILQTESPFWLEEAYQRPIADLDTGLAQRCIVNQARLEPIIHRLASDDALVVDVGGGYGLLCRLLRDRGFDCYTFDKYCENILAPGFEPPPGLRADVLLAFEVMEHIENPRQFLEEAFDRYGCRTIILSTLPFQGPIPPRDWWYYAFDSGQHITFYQRRTLVSLASALRCSYSQLGSDLHLITDKPPSSHDLLPFRFSPLARLYRMAIRWRRRGLSKTWEDHLARKR